MMTNKPISIDDHVLRCSFCGGGIDRIQEHHIIRRAQGGKDTIYACDKCHRQFTENRWALRIDDAGFSVWDTKTGEQVMRRVFNPAFDEGAYIYKLQTPGYEEMLEPIQYLSDDGIEAAAEISHSWGKGVWLLQACLIQEAYQRMPYGSRTKKLSAIAKKLGLGRTTAYNYMDILEWADVQRLEKLPGNPQRALLAAGKTADPQATLNLIEERLSLGVGGANIEREVKGQERIDWQECPCCEKMGDPKTFKWRET